MRQPRVVTLKGWRSMRWLEGWLGSVAGGAGLLVTFLSSVTSSHTLDLTAEYVPYYGRGSLPVGAQWIRLLIGLPTIMATLLFAGVLWGLWLDLTGQRTRGRAMLLACASIIMLLPFFSPSEAATMTLVPAMLFGARRWALA
jgi:hypothetical protein